jgi:molecular chaperone DnaK
LRKAPRGEIEVEVSFAITADGLVSVSAKDMETGREQSITVTSTSGLSEQELQGMANKSIGYAESVRAHEETEKVRQRVEKLVEETEGLLPEVVKVLAGTPFGDDSLNSVRSILADARAAMDRRDLTALEQVADPLGRTLTMFRGLVRRDRPLG